MNKCLSSLVILSGVTLLASPAGASVLISGQQVGADVVFTITGSLNTSSLNRLPDNTIAANRSLVFYQFDNYAINSASNNGDIAVYEGITQPFPQFSESAFMFASTSTTTGDAFAISLVMSIKLIAIIKE